MNSCVGNCRFVRNKTLDWNEEQFQTVSDHKTSYKHFCEYLLELKARHPWLLETSSQTLQQSVYDLSKAYTNYFEGHAEKPKHHKKFGPKDSFRVVQRFTLDEARKQVRLPCIGWVRYRRSRYIEGTPCSITVMRKADGWYMSVLVEYEEKTIDIGNVRFSLNSASVKFNTLPEGVSVICAEMIRLALKKLHEAEEELKRTEQFRMAELARGHVRTKENLKKWDRTCKLGKNYRRKVARVVELRRQVAALCEICLVSGAKSEIGLDMGCVRFATMSDGHWYEPSAPLKKNLKKLAYEQRRLSRMVKFGKNWRKQKEKIARLHKRIADIRLDFLEKVALALSNSHAMIYREDLQIKNMTKSAKGTVSAPGKNVAQKAGLNRTILDQAWGKFFILLSQKAEARGGTVFKVPPMNTSRTCPVCGHVSANNRKTQAHFKCEKCGFSGNADEVAAHNIMVLGQRMTACGASVETGQKQVNRRRRKSGGGQQQEPVEAAVSSS